MRRILPIALLLAAVFVALPWAQQAEQPAGQQVEQQNGEPAEDDRLAEMEERLELVEKALTQGARAGASPTFTSLETRLSRIEARLDQLERFAVRDSSAGGSSNRMLESRVRALEREVSSLRRF